MDMDVVESTLAMVLNRILTPQSKRATHIWLQEVYEPRFSQISLQHLYRSLDFLARYKEKIEEGLYLRVRNRLGLL